MNNESSVRTASLPTILPPPLHILCMFTAVAASAYIAITMFEGMAREGIIGVDYYTFVRNVSQPLAVSYAPHPTAPFSYPPTMPLLFWPFAKLGYLGFTALSVVAFLTVCRKHLPPSALCLAAVSFPVLNVISCGQLTALVIAIALFGLSSTDRRLAGLAFAVAAGLKPQLVAFFPLYLIAIRDWRAFIYAAGGYAGLALASILVFGAPAWVQWFGSIAQYRNVILTGDVLQWVITPIGMAERAGFPVAAVAGISAICALALPFLRYKSPAESLFGLSVASLCVLPYGLAYDALGIVPLSALLIARGNWLPVIPFSLIYPPLTMLTLLGTIISQTRKR